ncbi:MAG: indolepyruvate oxidoreductase subunit beta family protein [Kordiimonadaceae bacterium]|nr:indolepyruvate oxidoreductase subunit beta family protein [Kordiimonadaceae bacterium]
MAVTKQKKTLSKDKSINIAIIAMGGQGGGVLSKWILDMAEAQGYLAQYTSVPGVAQRTGATIYYIELFPAHLADTKKQNPVLALTPIPGDVDIVIASEMMEAGRSLMRGFVTEETTLIASDHRDYAIVEKQEMGDGRRELSNVRSLAEKMAGTYICFDMDTAARAAGSVISSVLFGALAGSNALPFGRAIFEKTITESKRAVDANLRGFALGYENAQKGDTPEINPESNPESNPEINPEGKEDEEAKGGLVPSASVAPLLARMKESFPPHAHFLITEGLKKLVDYQGPTYANLYLDRLKIFTDMDAEMGGAKKKWRLSKDMARYLALAMSYDDLIRVADLKTRATRFDRFRDEVKAAPGQIITVSEYMHPRLQEVCDVLPTWLGGFLLQRSSLNVFFQKGRRISTTKLGGFLLLSFMAKLKWLRTKSLRYKVEAERLSAWMDDVKKAVSDNYDLACEVAGLQRLMKGYGDTYDRGLENTAKIMSLYPSFKEEKTAASILENLKSAALKDEEGKELSKAIHALNVSVG